MTDISLPPRQAPGIGVREFKYPDPVGYRRLTNDLHLLTSAYIDVQPRSEANGSALGTSNPRSWGAKERVGDVNVHRVDEDVPAAALFGLEADT